MSATKLRAGESFTVNIKGVGWTELDNGFAMTYDNAYAGYACGFNSNGDVTLELVATGGPGTHLIDLYPMVYAGKDAKWWYWTPVLTYARDFPRCHWVIACRPSGWQSLSSTNPRLTWQEVLCISATSLVRRGLPLLAEEAPALALAGCNEVKQSDYDALKAQLSAKEQAPRRSAAKAHRPTEAAQPPHRPAAQTTSSPFSAPASHHPWTLFLFRTPCRYQCPPGCRPRTNSQWGRTLCTWSMAALTPSKYGLIASLGCVQQNVFKRGMKMVFCIEFYDMATGKRVTPQDQAIVKVKLGSGEEILLSFSRRGGPSGPPDAPGNG